MASLSTFYWRSNEESVEGDRPQKAPVLESRESDSAFASNSRADPVQGMSYRELFVTKILSLFIQPSNAASKTDSLLMARAPSVLLLLALATAATLAGVSCGGSTWPASMHSKPVAGPGVSTKTVTVLVDDDDGTNDNVVDHSRKEYPIQSQSQSQSQVKQAKRVVVVELLAVAKQKLKRFVRQLRCSALSEATATQQQQQQQQMLLAAR